MGSEKALLFSINRTEAWWLALKKNLPFETKILSDIQNKGDFPLSLNFNNKLNALLNQSFASTSLFSLQEINEIIYRCRLLRNLPNHQAKCMIVSMADSLDNILDEFEPSFVLSFPIDRYVTDILRRLVLERGIPFFEMTPGIFSNTTMFMSAGSLMHFNHEKAPRKKIQEIFTSLSQQEFLPDYIDKNRKYNKFQWLRIFLYFQLRGWVFKIISIIKRDKFNLHYLDAQSFLSHKPKFSDFGIFNLYTKDWKALLDKHDANKRVFFPLQLFPEASIDYWVRNLDLLDVDNFYIRAAQKFSTKGFIVVLKDHPYQFGFRKLDLIKRLLEIENVIFLPPEVQSNALLKECSHTLNLTGTLGFQAIFNNVHSVVTKNYYSNSTSFTEFNDLEELNNIIESIDINNNISNHEDKEIVIEALLAASFEGDPWNFQPFNVTPQGDEFNNFLNNLTIAIRKQLQYIQNSGH